MERLSIILVVLAVAMASVPAFVESSNHTVGGSAGWFFDDTTNTSATNYTLWAENKNFALGDFLIFNTDSNMKLVQTYNATTYSLCGTDEDDSDTTVVYEDTDNYGQGIPESLPLQLTVLGPNFYFSDDVNQCLLGMSFEVDVFSGQSQSPPDASTPPPSSKSPSTKTPSLPKSPPAPSVNEVPVSTPAPESTPAAPNTGAARTLPGKVKGNNARAIGGGLFGSVVLALLSVAYLGEPW